MKVAFDDQIVTSQKLGGISRYVIQLMQALPLLPQDQAVQPVPLWRWVKNEHAARAGLGEIPRFARRRPLQTANRAVARHAIRTSRPTLVHHTYYWRRYLRGWPSDTKHAVTLYDMIPELHPELFPVPHRGTSKKRFIEQADLILCISETTKRDLIELYGVPSAPIAVTPLSAGPMFQPGLPRPAWAPEAYLLFVGARWAYKDFDVLLKAVAAAPAESRELCLVAVGGGDFRPDEIDLIDRLGLSRRVRQVRADDATLAGLYCHAQCFVFPSRYEGFGIPTLEAMACGCPVISARSPAHIEVGGEAAWYFEPGNVDELSAAINRVHSDWKAVSNLRAAGPARAATFTWMECAAKTAAAYRLASGVP